MPAILKVMFKWLHKGPQHQEGHYCGEHLLNPRTATKSPDGILRLQVFCFLVKEEGHVNRVAGLT